MSIKLPVEACDDRPPSQASLAEESQHILVLNALHREEREKIIKLRDSWGHGVLSLIVFVTIVHTGFGILLLLSTQDNTVTVSTYLISIPVEIIFLAQIVVGFLFNESSLDEKSKH